jgi:DNA polymerase-1
MTASEMFGVPIKGMPPEIRHRAKAINFGIVYGISSFGLANQLGIPREEAGAYIKESKAYAKSTALCTRCSAATAIPGDQRLERLVRSFNERAAVNARLQGTAADILLRCLLQKRRWAPMAATTLRRKRPERAPRARSRTSRF